MSGEKDPVNQELEGRLRIVNIFRGNFRRFLNDEAPTIKLISIFFVPEMDEPTIANFPTHIKYDQIDKEFEKVIEKYRKSGSEPMILPPNTFKLTEFEGISDRLKAYIDQEVIALHTVYDLVALPGSNATVGKTRYYSANDIELKQPIEEIWTAMRSEEQNEPFTKKSKYGSALNQPLIRPKISIAMGR